MDNIDFVKELLIALKSELIKYRSWVIVGAVAIMFTIIGVGSTWKNSYVSSAMLEVEDSNIIQPLLKGTAEFSEVNRVEEARKTLTSKPFLDIVARQLGYIDDNTDESEAGRIISAIRRSLTVEQGGGRSKFFTLSYRAGDQQIAYETATVIVEEFVKYHQYNQRLEGEYAYDFIKKQADLYKKRLEDAELALQEFKTNSLDTNEESVRARIAAFEAEIQELQLAIQGTQSTITETQKQLAQEGKYLEVQSDIYGLKKQKAILEDQLTSLRMQYQESYPDIVSLKGQIFNIDQKIQLVGGGAISHRSLKIASAEGAEVNPELLFEQLRRQLSAAEVDLKSQTRRLASLQDLLVDEKEKADILAESQSEAADLMRDYTVNKKLYEDFLGRKENAELSVAITRDGRGFSYRVITIPSYPFEPEGLTLKHFVLVAPLLAFGIPIGLLAALVIVDPRIRTASSLKEALPPGVNFLGTINHCHTALYNRLLRKDMLILSGVFAVATVIYLYIAIIVMLSH